MLKRIETVLFVICIVMVFTAQANPPDNKRQQHNQSRPQAQGRTQVPSNPQVQNRPQVQSHPQAQNRPQVQSRPQVQNRPQAQSRPQVQSRREAPQQVVPIQRPTPRIYAVFAPAPVENNRLFHRQYHKNWQPRYNFYNNQYHFYPYVNIASRVEFTGGYVVVGPDGQNYYYDQGTFYLQDQGGQYVAVAPPVGIIVNPIASGARQIDINGQIFYRYKGVFYVQVAQGFQVVGPVQPVPADS